MIQDFFLRVTDHTIIKALCLGFTDHNILYSTLLRVIDYDIFQAPFSRGYQSQFISDNFYGLPNIPYSGNLVVGLPIKIDFGQLCVRVADDNIFPVTWSREQNYTLILYTFIVQGLPIIIYSRHFVQVPLIILLNTCQQLGLGVTNYDIFRQFVLCATNHDQATWLTQTLHICIVHSIY